MADFSLFTLASGRSGTSFLADFFAKNALQCYSTHEPYFTPGNPTLFGKAIEWNSIGNDDQLLPLLNTKRAFIQQCTKPVYFEANHAFLKSFNRHAQHLLDNVGYLHAVRHPLQVAKSEWLREQVLRKFHIPFIDYTSCDEARLFRWSLTGREWIFRYFSDNFPDFELTRFGFYIVQWFEMEYRAMQLIHNMGSDTKVFFIDVNSDLHNEHTLKNMLHFFEIPHRQNLDLNLKRNKTWFAGSSEISLEEYADYRFILAHLPEHYQVLFKQAPYAHASFADVLSGC